MTPAVGDYILFDHRIEGLIAVEVTLVRNNDLVRYFEGKDIVTGEKVNGGLYTDEDFARIKRRLTEMEVLAWAASDARPGSTPPTDTAGG